MEVRSGVEERRKMVVMSGVRSGGQKCRSGLLVRSGGVELNGCED